MIKQDLIATSPVRFFDKAANGGLKPGQMGLITAKKGLGKTALLIQFAIDSLLDDKHLIHISFDQHSSNVISWYDSILAEIGKKKNLSDMTELGNVIFRDRTILNSNQENFSIPKVVNTLKALIAGGIKIGAIVVDGADFEKLTADELKIMKDFVTSEGITAWFSSTNEGNSIQTTVKADLEPCFETIAHIENVVRELQLTVLKSNGNACSESVLLNTKTMLMCDEKKK